MESSGSKENKGSNMEKMKRSSNKELKYSTDVLTQLYEHLLLDKITQCLECRQIYVQIYVAICRRGRGLGLRKSTVFYMDLPALQRLNCGAGTGTVDTAIKLMLPGAYLPWQLTTK